MPTANLDAHRTKMAKFQLKPERTIHVLEQADIVVVTLFWRAELVYVAIY